MNKDIDFRPGTCQAKAAIELATFGVPSVTKGGEVLEFPTQKSLALFIFLSLHRKMNHSREKLAELFWPERSKQRSQQSLKNAIYEMRFALGDQQLNEPYLYVDRLVVGIHAASRHLIQIDSERFESLIQGAMKNSASKALPLLEQAITLHLGDFLEGFDDECFYASREHHRINYEQAITTLSDYYSVQGEEHMAIQCLLRMWEVDPYCEETLQRLMELYADLGHINRALALCTQFAERLQFRLGVHLGPDVIELYHAIASQKPSAGLDS